jgi:hypothetical protein
VEPTKQKNIDNNFEPFQKLILAIRDDPLLNKRIMYILQMDSFKRRTVLNNWLENLRIRHASDNLLSALSCLFDDTIANKVLQLITKHKI